MLINTVLIFLKNALPAFFLITISASLLQPFAINYSWKILAVTAGIVGALLLSHSMSFFSGLFDGVGAELLTAFFHFLIFIILLSQLILNLNSTSNNISKAYLWLFSLAVALVITLDGSSLLIYINGFWSSRGSANSIFIGAILGLGISLSSALLLLYVLRSKFLTFWLKLPYLAFVFTVARQFSELSMKLVQADWLPTSEPLWNSSGFLLDNSEAGRFFNALIGYEAAPSISQSIFYFIGLIIPILIIYLSSKLHHQVHS